MTERIRALREYILSHRHHALRRDVRHDELPRFPETDPENAHTAMALRLKAALDMEQPVLLPGEKIVFTRTVPELPQVFEGAGEQLSAFRIHERGNVCNISPDYGSIIGKGLMAVLREIDEADAGRNLSYYEAMRISIGAVLDLTARYAVCAREAGREDVAEVLDRVPAHAAQSFREALQSLRILHYCMWCEGCYHNTLGRFDQYMRPYFEKDMAEGRLTEEDALEMIEEFFLACNRDSDLYTGMQQGDNGQSLVLGGMTPEGEDGYSRLSELCLTASGELKVIDPKINLRVNAKTPLSVYERGTQLTKLGLGFPQYLNDDIVIPGLISLGYEEKDARNYVVAACWEFIIPGVGMDVPNIDALSFTGVVNRVIREKLTACASMDDLTGYVKEAVRAEARRLAGAGDEPKKPLRIFEAPYMSIFFDGCVAQGRDISKGNKYNNYGIHGTGVATAADSLAAVQRMVFERGVQPETLISAMDADFEGHEELHHALKFECPKMGNDEDEADDYACMLLDVFAESLKGITNDRGGIYRGGTGSAMYYIWHASDIGATADGRRACEPLPANYAPTLNTRLNGPASLIRSFVKPDLKKVINGGPLTIEFHDSVFRNGEAITKVAQLVRSFILEGGHQLQLNTVNREQLRDAQAHPENYRNLIVRVWGWSGYFVELDKCYQDHIIERVELMVGA